MLLSFLQPMLDRAEMLVPMLVVALIVGEWGARSMGLSFVFDAGDQWIAWLGRKLDRPQRSTATLVYRGVVALIVVALPVVAFGVGLSQPWHWQDVVAAILVISLLGRGFATIGLIQLARQARRGTLSLELPGVDFLFADTHAVLRYLILRSGEQFAVGVVGTGFWYIIGGLPGMLLYRLVATMAAQYRHRPFGWAVQNVFMLLDALPRIVTVTLLTVAALLIPAARPWAVLRARKFHSFISYLVHISLGGLMPGRQLPWVGDGTAKLLPHHFMRWLFLRLVASLMLVVALAAINMLIH